MKAEEQFRTRFQGFENTYKVFGQMVQFVKDGNIEQEHRTELEQIILRAGVVKQYELLIEMSWKTMFTYLIAKGVDVGHVAKPVINKAHEKGIIKTRDDAYKWIDAWEERNNSVHAYDENIPQDVIDYATDEFYPLAGALHDRLKEEL